jgi:hypothetical protein
LDNFSPNHICPKCSILWSLNDRVCKLSKPFSWCWRKACFGLGYVNIIFSLDFSFLPSFFCFFLLFFLLPKYSCYERVSYSSNELTLVNKAKHVIELLHKNGCFICSVIHLQFLAKWFLIKTSEWGLGSGIVLPKLQLAFLMLIRSIIGNVMQPLQPMSQSGSTVTCSGRTWLWGTLQWQNQNPWYVSISKEQTITIYVLSFGTGFRYTIQNMYSRKKYDLHKAIGFQKPYTAFIFLQNT